MKNLKIKHLTLLLLVLSFSACDEDDIVIIPNIPEEITITEPGLYPTKFDYNPRNNKFVVSSSTLSKVGYVDPKTGQYETFIKDENFALVTGIYVDEKRSRLLVASGDQGYSDNSTAFGVLAYLGVYDLDSGNRIASIDLDQLLPRESKTFGNDITVDDNGNIYVTDSFYPVIYKVDGETYEKSIFLNGGEIFTPIPDGVGFGINGIAYTNGNLIVSKTDDGALFKVPVSNPKDFKQIDAPLFLGVDGLEVLENGDIVIAETGIGPNSGAQVLHTEDNWDTATSISSFEILPKGSFPTIPVLASDNQVYIIKSFFPKSVERDLNQEFSIIRLQKD